MSDIRRHVKRKWSADKTAGPLVLACEWVQKALSQHHIPIEFEHRVHVNASDPDEFDLLPEDEQHCVARHTFGERLTEHHGIYLDIAIRNLLSERRVGLIRSGWCVWLDGQYHIKKDGKIGRGAAPPPF